MKNGAYPLTTACRATRCKGRAPEAGRGGDDGPDMFEDTTRKYSPRLLEKSPVKAYIARLAKEPIGFILSYVALASAPARTARFGR